MSPLIGCLGDWESDVLVLVNSANVANVPGATEAPSKACLTWPHYSLVSRLLRLVLRE